MVAVTAPLVAVIPAITTAAPQRGEPSAGPTARGAFPLPALGSARTSNVVYGLSAVDNRGRVVDRPIMRALDWPPLVALSITEAVGTLIMTPDPTGPYRVTSQGNVRIPAPLRHRCALAPGDRVLLAADPTAPRLTVYPPAGLDMLLGGEAA